MNAQAVNLKFISGIQNIEIPFFQRPYVWEEEQLERFFDDLKNSYETKNSHFLGSIILKQLDDTEEKFSLIDGQQRLTTFSVLIRALFNDIRDDGFLKDYCQLLYKEPTDNKIPKIVHSRVNHADFFEIITSNTCYLDEKQAVEKGKLWYCYYYFTKRLKEIDDKDDKKAFLTFIRNSKLLVKVTLENKDDEQKIFDSINSAGMVLTASDIIKNALFDRLLKLSNSQEDVVRLYENLWQNVFEDKESKKFWESKSKGRYKNELLLYYYAVINQNKEKKEFDFTNHNQDDLSLVYKETMKDKNFYKLKRMLEDIKQYAEIYKNLAWAKQNESYKFDEAEKRLMHIIEITDYESLVPLILKLKLCNLDKDELEKCFKEIEKLAVRNWIARNHTKSFGNTVAQYVKEVKNYETLKEILPKFGETTSNQIVATLKGKDLEGNFKRLENNRATLVLFWIELSKYTTKHDKSDLKYEYTLEHIMPQSTTKKINENWSSVCNDTTKAKELVYQIGNMILVTKPLNSTLSNKKWSEKKEGLRSYISLITSKEVLDKDDWNETTITDRTKDLIKEFFEIWGNDGELE